MKFGKEFKNQMVSEWQEAYMDYNGLKQILRQVREYKQRKDSVAHCKDSGQQSPPLDRTIGEIEQQRSCSFRSRSGDIEDQVIDVNTLHGDGCGQVYMTKFLRQSEDGGEIEVTFFRKLDEELNKVNTFYKDKVEEVKQEANHLDKQMDALVALRITVKNLDQNGSNSQRHRKSTITLIGSNSIGSETSVRCRSKVIL